MTATPDNKSFYLPDFCAARSVFAVVLIAELVAMVLTLAREELQFGFWIDLARTSLFLLWTGLCSAAVLCAARPRLVRMSTRAASITALGLLLAVTLLISEATFQIGRFWISETATGVTPLFPTKHLSFLLRNALIAFVVSALALRYFFVTHHWRHSVELKARARFDALQARIRPHFLFNSMNTIAALTRSDPLLAEEAVENLADLFRANLRETRQLIPLGEELQVAKLYQRIEELRLGTRLQVRWETDDLPLDMPVPSLLIQPLLENAIYHGIERLPEGGVVRITGHHKPDRIELTIANPALAEATGSRNPQSTGRSHHGNHIALDNIRERLELTWPGRAQLSVSEQDGQYSVTLSLPYSAGAKTAEATGSAGNTLNLTARRSSESPL